MTRENQEYDFIAELNYLISPESYGLSHKDKCLRFGDAARGALTRIECRAAAKATEETR